MAIERDVQFEKIAAELEASGDYRVLRKLIPKQQYSSLKDEKLKSAIFLDVETTGLDPQNDEVIELALVPFTYAVDGRISEVMEPYQSYQEPTIRIPSEVSALTGISDEKVRGAHIDRETVDRMVRSSDLIIAHNAAFDRKFVEEISPAFTQAAWACSMTQIPWAKEGFDGTKLKYLGLSYGFFYDAHRAVNDCYAGIELLSRNLPISGELAMTRLLAEARKEDLRIWVVDALYEEKGKLRNRGYRWNDGQDGNPRAWWKDVLTADANAEIDFLHESITRRHATAEKFPIARVTAYNRFSARIHPGES